MHLARLVQVIGDFLSGYTACLHSPSALTNFLNLRIICHDSVETEAYQVMSETEPLLAESQLPPVLRTSKDEIIIDFEAEDDGENPIAWSSQYKTAVVALLSFMSFTVTFTCISVVPVASRIVRDLDHSKIVDRQASVLLVTIWELGEALGPLLIGPLSELVGRRTVLAVSNALFIAASILAACAKDKHLFVFARFLTGAAVSNNVLNPAIVGDIYLPEQRGANLSLLFLAPMIGGAIGPAIAGAMSETLGWRQVLWFAALLSLISQIILMCFFRETYKVVILRRRASKLRKDTGNPAYITIFDMKDSDGKSENTFIGSIIRPARVLFGSYILQIICLFGGMTFTYYYIIATTLPSILETEYGLSPSKTGLSFLSFSLGSVITTIICNMTLDRIYNRMKEANGGKGRPEFRLPLVIFGALTMPFSIAAFGWATQLHLPVPVLLSAIALMGGLLLFGYLPVMAYTVDALGIYSASGMTATIVTRCLAGTFFPLSAPALIERLGYGWGFTVLAGISLALAPIPILLYRYGAVWRQKSHYMSSS